MLTNRQRRIVACVVALMICAAAVAPPAHAFTNESEMTGSVVGGFGLGAIGAWFESLWRPLASFWAMDGAKIMEGG